MTDLETLESLLPLLSPLTPSGARASAVARLAAIEGAVTDPDGGGLRGEIAEEEGTIRTPGQWASYLDFLRDLDGEEGLTL